MADANAREIAEAFVLARKDDRALTAYPGRAPVNLDEAYAIQDAALAIWDRPVGGWKVGRINGPDVEALGTDRLAGPIFADTIVEAGDEPTLLSPITGGFAAAEAEFMLRLAPVPGQGIPTTNEEARDWVDEIRIGIELASSPYPRINADGPCVTISDHGNNAGLVLGPEVPNHMWSDLNAIEIEVSIANETVGRGTVGTMLDGPFGAVRFLLQNLATRGIELKAGWWISTGAVTGVHEILDGETIEAKFGRLGTMTAQVIPRQS